MKTVHSNALSFMDTTDSRKLEVYITSNLPTTQIYNPNTSEYSPDWAAISLSLTTDVFLDSQELNGNAALEFKWYRKKGTDTKTQISTNSNITISTNEMSGSVCMITYICEVIYQGLSAQAQIAFVRTDTGSNGKDGTSITIDGIAYYNGVLSEKDVGKVVKIYLDSEFTTEITSETAQLKPGDAYISQGYLCVYNASDNAFICTGTIQGPKGEDAKAIILNGNAQVFKVSKTNTISPSTITITAQSINTTVSDWAYSVNGGQTFLSSPPNGVSVNGNQVTIAGGSITSNIIVIKASDGTYSDTYTVYKVYDGEKGDGGESAPLAFLTNENITFSADAQGRVNGATVTSNVVAYDGTTKVTPTIGGITGLPDGMTIDAEDIITINNELILSIVIANNATFGSALSTSGTISIPIVSPITTVLTLSWSKINTGATGDNGADAVTFQVYSADGYVLSSSTPSITLQTFAYVGDTPIEAGATYQWYVKNGEEWVELTHEVTEETTNSTTGETTSVTATKPITTSYMEIYHSSVSFSGSYMCKMMFNGNEYVDVVTIDDKNDINTIFTSKPSNYTEGDVWIVGDDYAPPGIEAGTTLKAQHTNLNYADDDWILATKYDDKIANLENDVNVYKQYISLDHTHGIRMSAIDENGNASEFSTTLSNTQLSFNQSDETVAYINNHKMYITEAEIESPLTVTGQYSGSTMLQAPTINLGSFSFVVESNGSLSIVSNL